MTVAQFNLAHLDRGLVLGVLAALLAMVVLWLLLRRLARRKGGWRRGWRWAMRELRLTGRGFTEPFRSFRHHRRTVRLLMDRIADPTMVARAEQALDAADAVLAQAPGAFAYAVRIDRATVVVRVAGRGLPEPPAPWRVVGPTSWEAPAGGLEAVASGRQRLPVVVGAEAGGAVVLDLLRGPGVLTVEGDPIRARTLVQALAAQWELLDDQGDLAVARGVHPRYEGPGLDVALEALERPSDDSTVTLVCVDPNQEQARRIQRLAASESARFLVRGRLSGHRWSLHANTEGWITAPGLALRAEAGPLGRAVARTVRRGVPVVRPPREPAPLPRSDGPASAAAAALPPSEAPAMRITHAFDEPDRAGASPGGVSAASHARGPRTTD
ncbi:hypothetical protein [Streptomyces lunalinharesii]|uniref:Type VII secretion protein EccE n=1 Tax=Streptomyces lunalinharesii TaxID=333384 RepID=A0ABN3SL35_9ACTN